MRKRKVDVDLSDSPQYKRKKAHKSPSKNKNTKEEEDFFNEPKWDEFIVISDSETEETKKQLKPPPFALETPIHVLEDFETAFKSLNTNKLLSDTPFLERCKN